MTDFTEKDFRTDDLEAIKEFASRCQGIDPQIAHIAHIALGAFKRGVASRYYYSGQKFGWLRMPVERE